MAFTGTLDKCKACDKTVYFVDLLSADGATFHKSCFKCSHCKGTLVIMYLGQISPSLISLSGTELVACMQMSNYSSMDGVLYCKPHFEQLFKESGNFSKNFQTSSKSEKESSLAKAPSKVSAMFSGTQDKCAACSKTVYPLEKVILEGEAFHKSCFKCAHGGCALTHATYAALDGVLYCKHHFAQLFMEKGSYQHVLKATTNKKSAVTPVDDDDNNNNNDDKPANEEDKANDHDKADEKEPNDENEQS